MHDSCLPYGLRKAIEGQIHCIVEYVKQNDVDKLPIRAALRDALAAVEREDKLPQAAPPSRDERRLGLTLCFRYEREIRSIMERIFCDRETIAELHAYWRAADTFFSRRLHDLTHQSETPKGAA